MAEIRCIDVSEWQGKIDWKKIKAAGIDYAVLRAGFGREASQSDSYFETNYKNAKAAGIKLGAYWYSYATDKADALREAEACVKVIKGKEFELPVFYDVEESSLATLGKTLLTDMVKNFCNYLKKEGFTPGVYANANFFKNHLSYTTLKNSYFIWLAQYFTEPQFECDMWQFSSQESVSGVAGEVDMNIIYNAEIIKTASTEKVRTQLKVGQSGLDILLLKTMLLIAHDMGLCTTRMTKGTDYAGEGMGTAIKQVQRNIGVSETGVADKDFVIKMYDAISAAYPKVGDVNGDGSVNIKDVTALQRELVEKSNDE